MDRISVAMARQPESLGRQVEVRGWVRTRRDSKGGFSFIELNDGSCMANLQIVADGELANYEQDVPRLSPGASIAVAGEIRESPGSRQPTELHASRLDVIGLADPDAYPLQKKRHSFEFLRTIAHLRPRSNTFGAIARVRNSVCGSIHDFFQQRDFLYIHTPVITASDCEGAGEMFRVTTLDPSAQAAAKSANASSDSGPDDFFGRPTYLTVSGQLEAEIYATALGKVYTFGPTFRAENSNTSRHLAEFWMVEPEMAFYELTDNMDLGEALIKQLIEDVLNRCDEDMQFFNQRIDRTILEMLTGVRDTEFVRMTYTEAVDILRSAKTDFEFPVDWGVDLQAEHERYLTEQHVQAPVILYDYPRTLKPFYMRLNDDERTVRAMDVLLPRVGEIIGGSQREERLSVLTERMRDQGLDPESYWWYLDLRRFGTVPHSGFGLGVERVMLMVTGMTNIRDVIPFPRTPGNAEF